VTAVHTSDLIAAGWLPGSRHNALTMKIVILSVVVLIAIIVAMWRIKRPPPPPPLS
jgi:hypothetical protein